MNKRALVFRTVAFIILVLALLVVGFNILGILREAGIISPGSFFDDYGDFTPYHLAPDTAAEATVQDSVNALVCAINMASALDDIPTSVITGGSVESYINGRLNRNLYESNCPDGDYIEFNEEELSNERGSKCYENYGVCVPKVDEDKAHYEEADYNPNDDTTCPRTRPECELQCKFAWGRSCEPTSSEVKICDRINGRYCMASGYWCQMICPFGARPYGFGSCEVEDGDVYCLGMDQEINYDSEIEENIEEYANQVRSGYDAASQCNKGMLFGASCVKCEAVESNFKCMVSNFNMPQTGAGDRGTLDRWISGLGDPEFVLYYEAFPEGEDEYWKPDYASYSPLLLYGASIASIVLPADKELIEAVYEGRRLADILTEHTLIGKIGGFLFKQAQRVKKGLFLLGIKNADFVARLDLIELSLRKSDIVFQDSTEFLPLIRRYVDENSLRITDELALQRELAGEFERQIARAEGVIPGSTGARAIEQIADEEAVAFMTHIRTALGSSSVDIAKARMARNLGLSLDQFYESGKISVEAVGEFLKDNPDRVEAFVELMESGALSADQMGDYIRLLRDTTDEFSEDWMQYHLIGRNSDGLNDFMSALGQNPEEVRRVGGLMRRIPVLRAGVQMAEWGRAISLGALSLTSTENRWFTMAFLYFMGDLIDSVNNKFLPHGVNNLVIQTPHMLGQAYTYELEKSTPYSIILNNNQKIGRFYFASPCKADLVVESTQLSTTISNRGDLLIYDLYDFGSGLMTVKKGTLNYKTPPPSLYNEGQRLNSISNYNTVLTQLRNIDTVFSTVSGSTSIDEVYNYANEKYADNEFEKALKVFMIITKYYPVSIEAWHSYSIVDEFLTDYEQFLHIPPDILKDIAFEFFIDDDDRIRYYSGFWEEIDHKLATGELGNYPEAIYRHDCINEDIFRNNLWRCDEISKNVDAYYNIIQDEFNVNSAYRQMFTTIANTQNRELYQKYFEVLFYVYESEGGEGVFQNTNSYTERVQAYEDYMVYPEAVMYRDTNPAYTNFGINLGQSWYKQGRVLIPTHVKYMKTGMSDQTISMYPNWLEFSQEYAPIYREFDMDTTYSNDNANVLFDKKDYIEFKASMSFIGQISEIREMYRNDIRNWIEINREIQRKDLVDPGYAIKAIKDIRLNEELDPDEITLTSSGIMITTSVDEETDPNYCYQEFNEAREALYTTLTITSLFMDDVVGGLAAYGCGQTVVLSGAAPWCYKLGSAAANFGFALIDRSLMRNTKWPRRGD